MSLILHEHPLSSYCWKVRIALYENGAAFETRTVNPGDPDARAAFAAMWPTGKIPLLQDGDRFVPETSIMIEHLDRAHPGRVRLLPRDEEALLQVRLWDRLFDNYVMDPMGAYIAQLIRPEAERDPRDMAEAVAGLRKAYGMIEHRLPGPVWAVGEDFTLADCAAAPSLFYAAIVEPLPAGHPRLSAYFERLMARPSVRRAIAEARPWFQYYPLQESIPKRFLEDDPLGI